MSKNQIPNEMKTNMKMSIQSNQMDSKAFIIKHFFFYLLMFIGLNENCCVSWSEMFIFRKIHRNVTYKAVLIDLDSHLAHN